MDPLERLAPEWPRGWPWLLFVGFACLCGLVYSPALEGEFISDDHAYLTDNPYTGSLDAESLGAMWKPFGDANAYTANYAPLNLTLHGLQRALFGDAVLAYHLMNLGLHALNVTLLVALLLASRVPKPAALFGGVVFALHPANVEAVAWISQLKSVGAMAFALGALLAYRRWPVASAVPFGLALLMKASASFALPFAAALAWAWRGPTQRHRIALTLWAGVFALYMVPQYAAHSAVFPAEVPAYADPLAHGRSMAAYGARYLVMAASSMGVAPFQQPAPAVSWLDPWWLAALPLGLAAAWRMVVTLRARREEGAWWLAAAAAFAPISQWFPFHSAVADRYLYFILPGLLGGGLLALRELAPRLGSRRAVATRAAFAVAAILVVAFGVRSYERAGIWQNEERVFADAARRAPDSLYAHHRDAVRLMRSGDAPAAVAALERAIRRGLEPRKVWSDPTLAPLRSDEAFVQLIHTELSRWLSERERLGWSSRPQLLAMGQVTAGLGRPREAVALLERALAAKGPYEAVVRAELATLRGAMP